MGSFIDLISRHGNNSEHKIQFDTCSFGNKGTKEFLVNNFILFVAYFKQKPQCI